MEGEEGSGIRLSKRFSGGKVTGTGVAEVDYKTKAGTAWSHNFLNQKPWHPLSYPNQRRKWIAEQVHAQRERRNEEVAREYQQEQDFFRQAALISKKDREKVEIMKAVSFMYVRPPGYNPESAKEAEIADERKIEEQTSQSAPPDGASDARPSESLSEKDGLNEERKKRRPKDVFGRTVPTEEEFEVLKNAPRLETGVAGRAKPFAVEVRNVKCLRCGNYGHQSGDRECALKDLITPNEEVRLKRDDPLTAIIAHTDPAEPLKWELKQKPGLSPPRGGFNPDDPNQQIVAEDIFDEYGGFLAGDNVPELLTKFFPDILKKKKSKRSKKHKKRSSQTYEDDVSSSESEGRKKSSKRNKKNKKKMKQNDSVSCSLEDSDTDRRNIRHKDLDRSEAFKSEHYHRGNSSRQKHSHSSEDDNQRKRNSEKNTEFRERRTKQSYSSEDDNEKKRGTETGRGKDEKRRTKDTFSSEEFHVKSQKGERNMMKVSVLSEGSDSSRDHQIKKRRSKHACSSEDDYEKPCRREKSLDNPYVSSDGSDSSRNRRSSKVRSKHSDSFEDDLGRHHRSQKRKNRNSHTTDDLDSEKKHMGEKTKHKKSYKTSYDSETEKHHRSVKRMHKDYYPPVSFSDRYGGSEKMTKESHHRNRERKDKHYYSSGDESGRHRNSKSDRRNDSQRR